MSWEFFSTAIFILVLVAIVLLLLLLCIGIASIAVESWFDFLKNKTEVKSQARQSEDSSQWLQ